MARLQEGRSNTARGAAHFPRETPSRARYVGATGPLTVGTDSGFYTRSIIAVCRKMKVRFSVTVHPHRSPRNLIEAIPEEHRTAIPYLMEGAADVAEVTNTPFKRDPGEAPVRLIARRVKPTPGSQLAHFANYNNSAATTLSMVHWQPHHHRAGPHTDSLSFV
ncbi:MAG: hypothetical protein OXI91_01135 [Chloroflexota bacterium]|nr:hypothetical protein [Chloroflexota bacterium]